MHALKLSGGRGECVEGDGCSIGGCVRAWEREERWMCLMKLPLGLRLLCWVEGRERGVVGCE